MKKLLCISGMVALTCAYVFILDFVCADQSYAKTIKMTLSNPVPEIHPVHKASLVFKEMLEKWTDGQVSVTIYASNQLGNPPSTIEQVLSGTLDITLVGTDAWQAFFKESAVEMIPFAYDDQNHIDRIYAGPAGKAIYEIYDKNGVIRLTDWIWGFRQMTNNTRAINNPADVSGLKMRVPPTIQLQQMYRALGAVVTTIGFPELYMALSQGVADGQCNPLWVISAFKIDEVQKYVAMTNHGYLVFPFAMSKKRWEKLPEDVKTGIKISAKLSGEYLRYKLQSSDDSIINTLKEKGLKITSPDRAEFRAKMKPVYNKIANFSGQEWMDQWMNWVEAAR